MTHATVRISMPHALAIRLALPREYDMPIGADTTPDDRAVIADAATSGALTLGPRIARHITGSLTPATLADALRVVAAEDAVEFEARRAKRAIERAEAIEQARAIVAARETVAVRDWQHSSYVETLRLPPLTAYTDDGSLFDPYSAVPEAATLQAEIEAENARRRSSAQAAAERAAAEKEAAKQAAAAERTAWIAECGSPRLRRLAAEQIEHTAVYRDERLALERPGWEWEPNEMSLSEPRNAPGEALDLLDRARATDPSARLAYYTVEPDEDDDGERGYVASATFLGRAIVSAERVTLD